MRTFGIVVSWLVLAAAASGLAWNVLAAADREVGAAPATPVLVVDDSSPSTTVPPSTSEGSTSTTSTVSPSDTATSAPRVTGSTSTSTTGSTSTTTAGLPTSSTTIPTTTTTAAAPAGWSATTVPSGGGVVVVGHRPGEVRLDSATPGAGFSMEIDKSGPDEVRVEFENDAVSIEIRARWEDGALTTEVDS